MPEPLDKWFSGTPIAKLTASQLAMYKKYMRWKKSTEPDPLAGKKKKKRVKRKFIRDHKFFRVDGAFAIDIGVRVRNEGNNYYANRIHVAGERKRIRTKVHKALIPHEMPLFVREVTFTRYAPSKGLDDDGLRSSLKSVRDQAVCWVQGKTPPEMELKLAIKQKADDGPACGLTFHYEQHESKEYGVRVIFK